MSIDITNNEYGFGSIGYEIEDRPVLPPVDPELNRIDYPALLREMRWSDQDFDTAKAYAFPHVVGYRIREHSSERVPYFRRDQIEQWRDALKAFAARVR